MKAYSWVQIPLDKHLVRSHLGRGLYSEALWKMNVEMYGVRLLISNTLGGRGDEGKGGQEEEGMWAE
jgi:hypothetical protein